MNEDHVHILAQGVEVWNRWRNENPAIHPDLSRETIMGIFKDEYRGPFKKGHRTNLNGINFSNTDLSRSTLESANMAGADLTGAKLLKANFRGVDFHKATFINTDLYETDLYYADFSEATIQDSRLTRSRLVNVTINGATIDNCEVFGISSWNVIKDEKTSQTRLKVNDPANTWEHPIYVNDIEVAQYINMFLDPKKVRDVIDSGIEKIVLILGRFTDERKVVLDKLREELKQFDLVPVIFDFPMLGGRSMIEIVQLISLMSRFVIADLTDAKLVINELTTILPMATSLVIKPIILTGQDEPVVLRELRSKRSNYLDITYYEDMEDLVGKLQNIIAKTEQSAKDARAKPTKLF